MKASDINNALNYYHNGGDSNGKDREYPQSVKSMRYILMEVIINSGKRRKKCMFAQSCSGS